MIFLEDKGVYKFEHDGFEYFSFLFIVVLFSAGNAKKTEILKFIHKSYKNAEFERKNMRGQDAAVRGELR